MQQIKLFKSVDSEMPEIEKEINDWIRKSGVRVLSITGNITAQPAPSGGAMNSFGSSDVLIVVMYEQE